MIGIENDIARLKSAAPSGTIAHRLNQLGWTIDAALNTPPRKYRVSADV